MIKNKSKKASVAKKMKLGHEASFVVNEAFKKLRTNVVFSFAEDDEKCKIIGITSSVAQEGKTSTSIGFAYSLSQLGKKVVLLECDLRKPKLSRSLGIRYIKGLTDLLVGEVENINEVLQAYKKNDSQFSLITCGKIPPNPSELLDSPRMEKILDALSEVYDYIVVDLPPVSVVTDPLVVAKYLDGMIMVVKHDYTNKKLLKNVIPQIQSTGTRLLGFVYTGYHLDSTYGSKYSSYYY